MPARGVAEVTLRDTLPGAILGGLLWEGLLDPSAKYLPRTADSGDEWMWKTTGPVDSTIGPGRV